MSEKTKELIKTAAKELIDAAAQAAETIDEKQATRLQGVIQGYAMAIKDQSREEKAS